MGYLFVSYSRWDRRDNPILDRLLVDLRTAGVGLWLVPDDLPPGIDWQEAKPQGLENADGLLYLFGRSLAKTSQIASELRVARDLGIPITVVVVTERAALLLPEHAAEFEGLPIFSMLGDYDGAVKDLIAALPRTVKPNGNRGAVQPAAPPKSRGYVFISYAEEDSAFVDTLRTFLAEKGYGYWDFQASDRNFHTQLFLELEEVIKNATATLSVLSPDWKKSTWTAKEYIFSEEVGTPVFLLMSREMGPTLVTAGVPYIDFTRDEALGFSRLDRELARKGLI